VKIDSIFAGFNISAAGLSAQRKRLSTIASNLANAETTKTAEGGPYKRKIVTLVNRDAQVFHTVLNKAGLSMATTTPGHLGNGNFSSTESQTVPAAIEAVEQTDPSPARTVYDPGNPDADANGFVAMPNVNVVTEMVNMISTSRSFEANVTAMNASKGMAKDALEI
jgi:flagellar basal-body rod protein FlgC